MREPLVGLPQVLHEPAVSNNKWAHRLKGTKIHLRPHLWQKKTLAPRWKMSSSMKMKGSRLKKNWKKRSRRTPESCLASSLSQVSWRTRMRKSIVQVARGPQGREWFLRKRRQNWIRCWPNLSQKERPRQSDHQEASMHWNLNWPRRSQLKPAWDLQRNQLQQGELEWQSSRRLHQAPNHLLNEARWFWKSKLV